MKWIGITGGIASGKSTVTKLLRTLGFEVLDADQISHQVTQVHGPALVQIYKTFGEAVRNPDGSLNRQLLGSMVFGRVAELKKLEAILHPLVREKIAAERARLLARGESAVFYDVPLLYEKQMETDFDAVVLVYCDRDQQLERLMKRNNLSQAEAELRIASQLPMEQKKMRTAHVIDNSAGIHQLEAEVRRVLIELQLKGKS